MHDTNLQYPLLVTLATRRFRSRRLQLSRLSALPAKASIAAAIALGLALAVGFAVWAASGDLAAPARRPLQAYHKAMLRDSAARGLSVRRFPCLRDTSACLLVEPDPSTGPTPRQRQLRAQLRTRGLALPVYRNVHGTLILLHARKGRKEDLLPVAERFAAAGFRCLIPDLPAHGESMARTTKFAADPIEGALPAQVLHEARRKFALSDEPAGLWGLSMGGAYAIRAAADSPQLWSSIVVVSGFDTLDGVVQDRLVDWGRAAGPTRGSHAGTCGSRARRRPRRGRAPARLGRRCARTGAGRARGGRRARSKSPEPVGCTKHSAARSAS